MKSEITDTENPNNFEVWSTNRTGIFTKVEMAGEFYLMDSADTIESAQNVVLMDMDIQEDSSSPAQLYEVRHRGEVVFSVDAEKLSPEERLCCGDIRPGGKALFASAMFAAEGDSGIAKSLLEYREDEE